ncbi:hypothetical protein [Halogeometricum borinquense]|uniref:hypothetical protein n=1 Tax=Halogeometricum borinquense TaxID=60847 RepID=UPI00343EBBE4
MRRVVTLSMVLVLVVASASAGMAAAASPPPTGPSGESPAVAAQNATETGTATNETAGADNETAKAEDADSNESSGGLSPGAQLAGVLAVQRTEIDGEIDTRSFEKQVASARSNESKAKVVSQQVNQTQERLESLQTQLEELKDERREGNLSQGRYRSQAAHLAAEIRSLQRLLDKSQEAADGLPPEARQATGLDEKRFDRLRNDTENLSRSEVSEVAREVAGENVGNGFARGPPIDRPGERGPPDRNESDSNSPGNSADAPGRDRGHGNSGAPGNAANETGRNDGQNEAGEPGNSGNAHGHGGERTDGNSAKTGPNRSNGNSVSDPGNSGNGPGHPDANSGRDASSNRNANGSPDAETASEDGETTDETATDGNSTS